MLCQMGQFIIWIFKKYHLCSPKKSTVKSYFLIRIFDYWSNNFLIDQKIKPLHIEYVSDTVLSIIYILFSLILITILWCRFYYYPQHTKRNWYMDRFGNLHSLHSHWVEEPGSGARLISFKIFTFNNYAMLPFNYEYQIFKKERCFQSFSLPHISLDMMKWNECNLILISPSIEYHKENMIWN